MKNWGRSENKSNGLENHCAPLSCVWLCRFSPFFNLFMPLETRSRNGWYNESGFDANALLFNGIATHVETVGSNNQKSEAGCHASLSGTSPREALLLVWGMAYWKSNIYRSSTAPASKAFVISFVWLSAHLRSNPNSINYETTGKTPPNPLFSCAADTTTNLACSALPPNRDT